MIKNTVLVVLLEITLYCIFFLPIRDECRQPRMSNKTNSIICELVCRKIIPDFWK